VVVEVDKSDLALLKTRFGLDKRDIAGLVGAQAGSKVKVHGYWKLKSGLAFAISVDHPKYNCQRMLNFTKSGRTISNEEIDVYKTGTGLGTKIFSEQVEYAASKGFLYIETLAGDVGKNGYYTWARLGYDAKLVGTRHKELFPKANNLSDLMRTKRGRDWWKANGRAFKGRFDLRSGSTSLKVLRNYVKRRKLTKNEAGPDNEIDEKLLDWVWDNLDSLTYNVFNPSQKRDATGKWSAVGGSKQTDSPAFKAWFGDSKVVDEHGKPKVVYHGTTAESEFKIFTGHNRERISSLDEMLGSHFAADQRLSYSFTHEWGKPKPFARTIPVYLSIQNPKKIHQKMIHGELEHDEYAIRRDIRNTVLTHDKPLFVQTFTKSRGISKEVAADVFDRLSKNEAIKAEDYGGEGWRVKHDPAQHRGETGVAGFYANYDSGLNGLSYQQRLDVVKRYKAKLRAKGYDGIVYENTAPMEKVAGGDNTCYIPFHASQIKSAIGNQGTFSKKSPSILNTFNPGQKRDKEGKWVSAGGGSHGELWATDVGRLFPDVHTPVFHATTGPKAIKILDEGFKAGEASDFGKGNVGSVSMTSNLDWAHAGHRGNYIFLMDEKHLSTLGSIKDVKYAGVENEYERRFEGSHIPKSAIKGLIVNKPMAKYEREEAAEWGIPVVYKDKDGNWSRLGKPATTNSASKTRQKASTKSASLLRYDPSRTATLRRAFETEVRRRFNKLRLAIRELVIKEDAFGLTTNAFDPNQKRDKAGKWSKTGQAKTVPEIHGLKFTVSKEHKALIAKHFNLSLNDVAAVSGALPHSEVHITNVYVSDSSWGETFIAVSVRRHDYIARREIFKDRIYNDSTEVHAPNRGLGTEILAAQVKAAAAKGFDRLENLASQQKGDTNGGYTWARLGYDAKLPGFREGRFIDKEAQAIVPGATRISDLMKSREGREWWKDNAVSFEGTFDLKEGSLSRRVLDEYVKAKEAERLARNENAPRLSKSDEKLLDTIWDKIAKEFIHNTRFSFLSSDAQAESFRKWLARQLQLDILSDPAISSDDWWTKYIAQAYKKGAARAYDDAKKPHVTLARAVTKEQKAATASAYVGGKQLVLGGPVSVEKVKLLASRTYTDLEGITTAMTSQISRALIDGLIQGSSPEDIAESMGSVVDKIGINRATTLARTEIVRAHAEAQLDVLEQLGHNIVKVNAEFSTARDGKVCEECSQYEGRVFTTGEARGLIPIHPNCRCSILPAVDMSVTKRRFGLTKKQKRHKPGRLIRKRRKR
jgi:SPP1 gp7 family putative phage head morphogenesis protein